MKQPVPALLLRPLVVAATVLAAVLAALPAAAGETLQTRFVLLAGRPAAEAGTADHGVLVVPGVVMPLGDAPPSPSRTLAGAEEVATLARKLETTLGLEAIEVLYTTPQTLEVNKPIQLQPPSAGSKVGIHVVLQGFNDEAATYRVRFTQGTSTFADSVVSVPRLKRALVGGLDGDEAPYLFLVVEPAGTAQHVGGDITPPQVLDRPSPQYTAQARAERIQGVVILQMEIDRQGQVKKASVLKGLPAGLSEAAMEAVRQWRFQPARDGEGNPVAVYYNITINFRLPDEPETPIR